MDNLPFCRLLLQASVRENFRRESSIDPSSHPSSSSSSSSQSSCPQFPGKGRDAAAEGRGGGGGGGGDVASSSTPGSVLGVEVGG